MPTYQYACTECGVQSEVVQKFTDDALTICVACGGRLRKVFSAVGIVFKGPGFYRTDSRAAAKEMAGSAQKRNGSDAAAKTSGESASGGDSKAAGSGSSGSAPSGNGSSSGNGSGPSGGGSPDGGKSSAKVA
ncbi:MAG: FmdB family zinc ribbon protein [Micromonosporaceae bacterium]